MSRSDLGRMLRLVSVLGSFFVVACSETPDPEKRVPPVPAVESARMVVESTLAAPSSGTGCQLPASNGLVDLFNVPRRDTVAVRFIFSGPTFKQKWDFHVESKDTNVVRTLDFTTKQPGKIKLTVEKDSNQSSPFYLEGVEIDRAQVHVGRVTNQRQPELPDIDYAEHDVNVVVWDIEEKSIVDYNALGNAAKACYDPLNSPALKADVSERTRCGLRADTIAADGTSLQLLRVKAGGFGKVCFSFKDGGNPPTGTRDQYYGKFSDPIAGGTSTDSPATNIATVPYQSPTEAGVRYWGFGTYTPPSDFFQTEEKDRDVEVEVQFVAQNENGSPVLANVTAIRKTLKIRRAPVLLVHGLWSSNDTWEFPYTKPTQGERRIDSTFSYDGNLPYTALLSRDDVSDELLDRQIAKLIEAVRKGSPSMATTKIDVIAHSMGGLYTRQWLMNAGYLAPANFNKGDVRKLATLSTPHHGSRLANALINLHENFSTTSNHDEELATLEEKLGQDVHMGAICELAEGSAVLSNGATTGARARAYTASGGLQDDWNFGIRRLLGSFSEAERQTHSNPYIFFIPNDGIVARVSQAGGLPTHPDFPSLLHTQLNIGDDWVTRSSLPAVAIYRDLDSPDGWADQLPQFTVVVPGAPTTGGRGAAIDAASYEHQCEADGAPMYQFIRTGP